MAVANAADSTKKVGDPNAEYESMRDIWQKCRAICSGERFAKALDTYLDIHGYSNLLIPFSPSMTDAQYKFYKAEAELPGITAQFARMLVGGLLRKEPMLELPDGMNEDIQNWMMNNFTQDNSTITSFLDDILWEEIQTGRAWIYVDYPVIPDVENATQEEIFDLAPFPVMWKAENIINWRVSPDEVGNAILRQVIIKGSVARYTDNEFHPEFIETVYVHELDDTGHYQIRVFEKQSIEAKVPVVAGQKFVDNRKTTDNFVLVKTIQDIKAAGERLKLIPAWPLNGTISVSEPILSPIVDKEVSLYNKVSRRNHLLYGASTYTPIIKSDMLDEDFDKIVDSGLGTWIKLGRDDDASVLETPTAALKDMDRAIAAAIEEMAKLGIRMLSPETAQSGVALELRNAAQNAQLGSLNNKVSVTISKVIAFMIFWKTGDEIKDSDIGFQLSADFNPIPLGADWLRLATEWYENGLIPRSIWLQILKQNDIMPPDYDDDDGLKEINNDEILLKKEKQNEEFFDDVNTEA